MPRSRYAATRPQLIDRICDHLTAGYALRQVADLPDTPNWDTLQRWQRADPVLRARFAEARVYGRSAPGRARHANRLCFPSADALALLERVRAGARLTELVDARQPDRAALNAWKRL